VRLWFIKNTTKNYLMLFCQLTLIFNHKIHKESTKFKRNQSLDFSRDGSENPFMNCHGFKPVAIHKRLKRTAGK
jgi:hypothetical protein